MNLNAQITVDITVTGSCHETSNGDYVTSGPRNGRLWYFNPSILQQSIIWSLERTRWEVLNLDTVSMYNTADTPTPPATAYSPWTSVGCNPAGVVSGVEATYPLNAQITVTDSCEFEIEGVYQIQGNIIYGRPWYRNNDGSYIYWSVTRWELWDIVELIFYNDSDTPTPPATAYSPWTAVGCPTPAVFAGNGATYPLLGIGEVDPDNVTISPNPVQAHIHITGLKQKTQYEIYDILGARMLNGTLDINDVINVGDLSAGVYFIKFKNANMVRFIKK